MNATKHSKTYSHTVVLSRQKVTAGFNIPVKPTYDTVLAVDLKEVIRLPPTWSSGDLFKVIRSSVSCVQGHPVIRFSCTRSSGHPFSVYKVIRSPILGHPVIRMLPTQSSGAECHVNSNLLRTELSYGRALPSIREVFVTEQNPECHVNSNLLRTTELTRLRRALPLYLA